MLKIIKILYLLVNSVIIIALLSIHFVLKESSYQNSLLFYTFPLPVIIAIVLCLTIFLSKISNASKDKLEELNPEKAHMGYYSTCFENNKIQIAFYHVQSNIYISRKEFEVKGDSLIVKTLNSPQSVLRTDIYFKKKLTKKELVFKPDW